MSPEIQISETQKINITVKQEEKNKLQIESVQKYRNANYRNTEIQTTDTTLAKKRTKKKKKKIIIRVSSLHIFLIFDIFF